MYCYPLVFVFFFSLLFCSSALDAWIPLSHPLFVQYLSNPSLVIPLRRLHNPILHSCSSILFFTSCLSLFPLLSLLSSSSPYSSFSFIPSFFFFLTTHLPPSTFGLFSPLPFLIPGRHPLFRSTSSKHFDIFTPTTIDRTPLRQRATSILPNLYVCPPNTYYSLCHLVRTWTTTLCRVSLWALFHASSILSALTIPIPVTHANDYFCSRVSIFSRIWPFFVSLS
ncbi:MAG: hypothetical protein JOS17DRAFT_740711 [Linnemannia elongata]|nr:MAG: hypothetical protein JOS17DRAFT_740711 [Linnemannia elongata]